MFKFGLSRGLPALFSRRCLATAAGNRPPTGILLMNLGGPHDLDAVEQFLTNLFLDKDLIPLPFQAQLAPWIAKRRTKKIQDQYAQIGGGSPIKFWTEQQGNLLAKALDKLSPQTAPHKPYIGFRYANPLTEDAVKSMKADGVENAVALTLYPQYSCSTTGSSLNELWRTLQTHDPNGSIKWKVVDRWPTHPGLVEAYAENIKKTLAKYPESERNDVVLLFSAHSLPMVVVNRGDPYPGEIAFTVQHVMEKLNFSNPYRIIWQSQVGPQPWLGPKTDEVIDGYAKQGKKNLAVIPIAFVSDHIETLFEVDIEYGHLAEKSGVSGFKRVESLNDHPKFIEALADLTKKALENPTPVSAQLKLRCPRCPNETCGHAKQYFAKQ
ncbi:hypothetical protein BJ742DRAFT_798568 [Cladochytrium replicatum]|nr:hypothetical protein BJ742DRAFT_798568 [Cladochytrium replicatum]